MGCGDACRRETHASSVPNASWRGAVCHGAALALALAALSSGNQSVAEGNVMYVVGAPGTTAVPPVIPILLSGSAVIVIYNDYVMKKHAQQHRHQYRARHIRTYVRNNCVWNCRPAKQNLIIFFI